MEENTIKNEINSFQPDEIEKQDQDSKSLIAGILLLIAGILGLLTWIGVLSFDMSVIDYSSLINQSMMQTQNVTITPTMIENMIQICATIGIILSIFPILGGILSIQKKLLGLALSCSIIGLFTIGPFFVSSILSLISLILLILSKDQFCQSNETSYNEW